MERSILGAGRSIALPRMALGWLHRKKNSCSHLRLVHHFSRTAIAENLQHKLCCVPTMKKSCTSNSCPSCRGMYSRTSFWQCQHHHVNVNGENAVFDDTRKTSSLYNERKSNKKNWRDLKLPKALDVDTT